MKNSTLILLVIVNLIAWTSIGLLIGSIFQPLETYVISKNFNDLYEENIDDYVNFDMDRDMFLYYVQNTYEYKEQVTDCKFYSMLWYKYFEYNGWKTKFMRTDNHIFLMAWKDKYICIADVDTLNCQIYTDIT